MRALRPRTLPHWMVGLLSIVLVVAALYLAFTKELPWSGGYEVRAVMRDAQTLAKDAPVRVAGVDVGEVTSVEPLEGVDSEQGAAVVTMRISDKGRPIHTDATLELRPRLFLEGNYFIDLRPGSPSAPEAAGGYTIPISSTSSSVQLDQVLTTLQQPIRGDIQVTLAEFANALYESGGAKGLRRLFRSSPAAFRSTARVNYALLGTRPHDLSGLVRHLDRVFAALDRNEVQLSELVVNLNRATGALAGEHDALESAVARLPGTLRASKPALTAINGSLPQLRAFAREALPGVRAMPPALDAAVPLLRQLRKLVSPAELRGTVARLRHAVPPLAHLVRGTTPFLRQARRLSSCFNEVVIPWSNATVNDPETPAVGRIFEETTYGLVGINGESRSADGNGPYARVLGGGGTNTVVYPPAQGTTGKLVGVTPQPILGARPSLDSSAKTPFRPDVPCESQDPPNLDSGDAAPPPEQHRLARQAGDIDPSAALRRRLAGIGGRLDAANHVLETLRTGSSGRRALRAAQTVRGAEAELNRVLAEALGWESLLKGKRR